MVFATFSSSIENVAMMVGIVADQIGMGIINVILITTIQFVVMMEETVAKAMFSPLATVFVRMKTTMQDAALTEETVVWQASTQPRVLIANARQKMK